jgi:Xaa-Pro aminopeptidase
MSNSNECECGCGCSSANVPGIDTKIDWYIAPDADFEPSFPPVEYSQRRAKMFDAIGEAHALLQGAAPVRGYDVFRQTNEFLYTCGVEIPQAMLMLDGINRKTILYLPSRGDKASNSEGAILGVEDSEQLIKLTGVDEVCATEMLAVHLKEAKILYTPHSPAEGLQCARDTLRVSNSLRASDPWSPEIAREFEFIGRIRSRFPRLEVRDLSPILDKLRGVKTPREIKMMRRAGALTGIAVREAIKVSREGMFEYQLGAVASFIYFMNGAKGDGYRAIIAGGPANTWFSHYWRNNCPLKDGDMALMDVAPEVAGYTSDIGRMWPVNGKYAPWQRELYGWIVEYQKVLLAKLRGGVSADQVMDECAVEMGKLLETWTWSKEIYKEAARRTLEFRGHLSHPVGMAVHDVGNYREGVLVPGETFAVDPQMWIPEEELYIRVEDTGVVTETGFEIYTKDAPLELDDVEALIAASRS